MIYANHQLPTAIYSYYQSPAGHTLTDIILSNNMPEVIASGADLYNLVYARIGQGKILYRC